MAIHKRLSFLRTSDPEPPEDTDVLYLNAWGELVKKLADGTESVVVSAEHVAATIAAHEAASDPHPQYLTADS